MISLARSLPRRIVPGSCHALDARAIHRRHDREDAMLKGIDPRLNADVLGCLRAMGHGDMLIVSDTNFPADAIARATVLGRLLRMENLTAAQAIQAILSVLPLDTFVDDFAGRMQVGDQA